MYLTHQFMKLDLVIMINSVNLMVYKKYLINWDIFGNI